MRLLRKRRTAIAHYFRAMVVLRLFLAADSGGVVLQDVDTVVVRFFFIVGGTELGDNCRWRSNYGATIMRHTAAVSIVAVD